MFFRTLPDQDTAARDAPGSADEIKDRGATLARAWKKQLDIFMKAQIGKMG